MNKILIVGATSAIAQAVARQLAELEKDTAQFILVGRNLDRLESIGTDLSERFGCVATSVVANLDALDDIDALIQRCWDTYGGVDIALIAHGDLPDQAKCENDWAEFSRVYNVNALSYMAVMHALALRMEKVRQGTIAAIGSVAGDRGRKSNYAYGSAKGAVAIFCQGLRNRLFSKGVHVLTVKPGFVDTPMTAAFDKSGPLWATPDVVAKSIVKGIVSKKNTIYTPGFWWLIMTVITNIPEMIFKRLSL